MFDWSAHASLGASLMDEIYEEIVEDFDESLVFDDYGRHD